MIYNELVTTTKEYMRNIITIEPKWLIEVAPRYFRQGDPTKLSKRKRQEKFDVCAACIWGSRSRVGAGGGDMLTFALQSICC